MHLPKRSAFGAHIEIDVAEKKGMNENNKKIKTKRKTKFRNKLAYAVFRPFFRLYFKLRYRYSYEKFKGDENGLLVLSNHATTMDPFFVALSFKKPLYFVASDQFFNLGLASRIIEYLVAPIPKSKGVSDVKAVRDIKSYLDEGANVAIFAEGNRTFTGVTVNIPEQIGKLVKLLKKTLVLYNLRGGYLSKPRWARKPRRGKMRGEIKRVLTFDDYKDMPPEELYSLIKDALSVNAYEDESREKIKFRSRHSAEYIEIVLYFCPRCKKFHTIYSCGNEFFCKNCGLRARYNDFGEFEYIDGKLDVKNVLEWYNLQNEIIEKEELYKNHIESPIISFDGRIYIDERAKNRIKLFDGKFSLFSDRAEFLSEKGETLRLDFSDIIGMTPQTMGKMQIYTSDKNYVITCDKRTSALSAVTLFYMNKNAMEGKTNEFLGQ